MKRLVASAFLFGLTGCVLQPVKAVSRVTSGEIGMGDAVQLERGAAYAEANCAACHAVGLTGDSPLPAAPRFRELGLRYPVEDLAEAFAEGIDTAHPDMPEFVMSTQENSDLIVYLKSIQRRSTR